MALAQQGEPGEILIKNTNRKIVLHHAANLHADNMSGKFDPATHKTFAYSGIVSASGKVVLIYGNCTINCDSMHFDEKTNELQAYHVQIISTSITEKSQASAQYLQLDVLHNKGMMKSGVSYTVNKGVPPKHYDAATVDLNGKMKLVKLP